METDALAFENTLFKRERAYHDLKRVEQDRQYASLSSTIEINISSNIDYDKQYATLSVDLK